MQNDTIQKIEFGSCFCNGIKYELREICNIKTLVKLGVCKSEVKTCLVNSKQFDNSGLTWSISFFSGLLIS